MYLKNMFIMKEIRLILSFSFLLVATPIFAQFTITGKVIDSAQGTSLWRFGFLPEHYLRHGHK
jgi:hypothetical protein